MWDELRSAWTLVVVPSAVAIAAAIAYFLEKRKLLLENQKLKLEIEAVKRHIVLPTDDQIARYGFKRVVIRRAIKLSAQILAIALPVTFALETTNNISLDPSGPGGLVGGPEARADGVPPATDSKTVPPERIPDPLPAGDTPTEPESDAVRREQLRTEADRQARLRAEADRQAQVKAEAERPERLEAEFERHLEQSKASADRETRLEDQAQQLAHFAESISGTWWYEDQQTSGDIRTRTEDVLTIGPGCAGQLNRMVKTDERSFFGWRERSRESSTLAFRCDANGRVSGDVSGQLSPGGDTLLLNGATFTRN